MKRAIFPISALAAALFLAGCNSLDQAGHYETAASTTSAGHYPAAGQRAPYSPIGPDGTPRTASASAPAPGTVNPGALQPASPYRGTAPEVALHSRNASAPTATAQPRSASTFPSFPAPKPAGDPPGITAKCALLVDGMGRVLYEKNADQRVPVASTQKLLLGILIVENGNLGKRVTVEESDTWAEPTKMGIQPGQTYTREELLRAVLIRSSNDIARCLARDHSGSVSAFAAAMNVRARQLGMHNSHFTNASGLPKPSGQYSTARDLAVLARAAMRHPFIRSTVGTKTHVFRYSNGEPRTLTNTNKVLRSFSHCTGAKTGYTHAAGRCLVSTASGNGRSVTSVILGSSSPNVWTESEALLRYGLGM